MTRNIYSVTIFNIEKRIKKFVFGGDHEIIYYSAPGKQGKCVNEVLFCEKNF